MRFYICVSNKVSMHVFHKDVERFHMSSNTTFNICKKCKRVKQKLAHPLKIVWAFFNDINGFPESYQCKVCWVIIKTTPSRSVGGYDIMSFATHYEHAQSHRIHSEFPSGIKVTSKEQALEKFIEHIETNP